MTIIRREWGFSKWCIHILGLVTLHLLLSSSPQDLQPSLRERQINTQWNNSLCSMTVNNCILSMHVCMLSCFSRVQVFAIQWTAAHQAPLSMGLSKQEYWSGLPCPPPGDLPNSGTEPTSLVSPALAEGFF